MQEARAILLRRYRFSENSLVVVWLTDTHGKVKTSVRSATKPGSPFAGRLELFTDCCGARGDFCDHSPRASAPSSILKRSWPNCSACRIRRFLRIVPWRPLPINFPRTGSGCWLS